MNQDLNFNILTFSWPKTPVTFYFSKEQIGGCQKIYKTKFPKNIDKLFPGISASANFIYTTFIFEKEGYKPLPINFQEENNELLKHYYNWRIGKYFTEIKNEIVKRSFIDDRQIWLRDRSYKNATFAAFDKFTLKIQFQEVSNFPELIISYDGQTKILKEPISQLIQSVSPTLFKGVLHKKQHFKFHQISDEVDDFSKTYAILNNDLRTALGYEELDAPDKKNKYIKYKALIDKFKEDHLLSANFNEIIPLNTTQFIKVEPKRIGKVNDNCNDLVFKNGTGRVPKIDFKKLKPFKTTPHKSIHLFFILHESYGKNVKQLQHYLEKEHNWFKGLYNYTGILYHVEPGFSIVYKNEEDPFPEIKAGITNLNTKPDITYVALYLSPFRKHEPNKSKREVYYKVKEELLKKRIVSQVIDYAKLQLNIHNFVMELTNISLALLAKLEGIPWQLNVSNKKELVIGVGAFKNIEENIQYIASAFCFQNNGKFNGFEYFTKSDTKMLSGAICDAIHNFTAIENNPDKVVIHFYKEMNDKELQPIINKMQLLDLGCPLYIININKTKSEDLIAYDPNWNDKLMPKSGTFINISNTAYKYLLFNNNRYNNDFVYPDSEGYPFPIKLEISSPTPNALKDNEIVKKLIEQVYQFSRLYWKSLRQQNVPVTIKYPEMVAEIAPHFTGGNIPNHANDKLWFL
jgi:hypothetical protein